MDVFFITGRWAFYWGLIWRGACKQPFTLACSSGRCTENRLRVFTVFTKHKSLLIFANTTKLEPNIDALSRRAHDINCSNLSIKLIQQSRNEQFFCRNIEFIYRIVLGIALNILKKRLASIHDSPTGFARENCVSFHKKQDCSAFDRIDLLQPNKPRFNG